LVVLNQKILEEICNKGKDIVEEEMAKSQVSGNGFGRECSEKDNK